MDFAVDSAGVDQQPEPEYNIYLYLYFVVFILFGSFFSLKLFIGVILNSYKEQNRKTEESIETSMSKVQKRYYSALKRITSRKLTKGIPRPTCKLQAIVFDVTTSKKFDSIIIVLVCLNMVALTTDHYNSTDLFDKCLQYLNICFIALFTVECVLKIFAFRTSYFKDPWNLFDFIVVAVSISAIVLRDILNKKFMSPIILRVVRLSKMGHIFRKVKGVRRIRALLLALTLSLPRLCHITLLYFLIMSIYAVFGMSLFMDVQHTGSINEVLNFKNFFQSLLLLFQLSTSAGWNGVLSGLTEDDSCMMETDDSSGCVNYTVAVIYLVSYLFIMFIIVNMFSAAVLENFHQAIEDVEEGLTDDDYNIFYEVWKKFDPDGTGFMKYSELDTFHGMLEEPLKTLKPNKYELVVMDIPIYKNDVVCCVDVLQALTKNFFVKMGNHIKDLEDVEVNVVKHQDVSKTRTSSTMWRQREAYAARVLQYAWRQHHGKYKRIS